MPDFRQQYKNPRPGFGDASHRRYLRAYNCDRNRRAVRTRTFDQNRGLQNVSAPTSPHPEGTSTDERANKLIKWKQERDRKRRQEAVAKKPAFKVGVVHHSLCSPMIKSDMPATKTPKKPEPSIQVQRRITRATEKRLLAKAAKQAAKDLTSASMKQSASVKTASFKNNAKQSFAPINYNFKPPSALQTLPPLFGLVPLEQTPQEKYHTKEISQSCTPTSDVATGNVQPSTSSKLSPVKQNSPQKLDKSTVHCSTDLNVTQTLRSTLKEQAENQADVRDSSQEEKLSSSSSDTKTPPQNITPTSCEKENCSVDLIVFSPYLTRSRGKRNSRKEGQQRLGIGHPSGEIPTKDTVMKNLNICVEDEERTAQYFKLLLNKEVDRLQELCKKWLDIKLQKNVPEDATYEIQQAVGQTNLLINKKFERFRCLVQDCETGRGEMLVTCRDLQGFWEMAYMEVENCDSRFEKLEQRRNRGWQEEEEDEERTVVTKPVVKKRVPVKKQIVSSKQSSLRSLILAARQKKMEAGTLGKKDMLPQDVHISENSSNRKSFTALDEENTRRIRRSKSQELNASKSSDRCESSRASSMQFSDKSKKMRSPFAAMKISQMCKTPEIQLDDTISYVNSDQTPGKSILKKSEELENKEARIKSAHKVNFDDRVALTEVPVEENVRTVFSLAAALNKIDTFDFDQMNQSSCINAERRLVFEVTDSDSDNLDELRLEKQPMRRRNKSRSSVQNISDNIVHPLGEITSFSSTKESLPDNAEITSSRRSLRNRSRRKDASGKKSVDIPVSPPTRDSGIDTIAEIISKDMKDNLALGKRVLRNRTVTANDTPKSNRTSKMMTPKRASIKKEEHKSSPKPSRTSSLKLSPKKDENMTPNRFNTMEMTDATLTGSIKRRSHRKSVAFDVLPMTPYSVHRNKTPSRQSRSKHDEDLILWETPDRKHRLRRTTRSQSNLS
ncbi:PREDICTED: disks large-associated protein 5-like isoform X2 [Vollenhovia emeryi]|uniref:disks large-associated protein 5-like isoform X2 n=1 Tax=Vollenhovia emeryi TaxID=411798 RepID=UPI0005F45494|nr:PREDICTED: disks large-associated protein 5-like isoform X2 [Vollenhovia emeryi]